MDPKNKIINYILPIICLFMIIYNLVILRQHQPVGYVINIYELLPVSFYIASILCYILGSILLIKYRQKIALYILVMLHIEILIIPYMLGYFMMGRADDMTYLGGYTSIMNSGMVDPLNIYPASYAIGSVTTMLTNIETNMTAYIIAIAFSLIFVMGMAALLRRLISIEQVYNIALVSSFIFYFSHFHFSIAPHYLFFCMIPIYLFALFQYMKKNSIGTSATLLFLLMLAPFTHPFIYTFLAYFMALLIIGSRIIKTKFTNLNTGFIILNTGFILWFISNSSYLTRFGGVYKSYINRATEPVLTETTGKLSKIDLDILELIRFLNIYYGRYLIPAAFIIISTIIVYRKRESLDKLILKEHFSLLVLYIAFFALQVIFFLNPAVSHQPDRISNLNFVVFAQIPLFAYSLYTIFLKNPSSKKGVIAVITVLAVVWSFSLFGCFSSPHIYRTSGALTENEVTGMSWFYEEKSDHPVNMGIEQVNRYHDLFADNDRDPEFKTDDHFGYNEQDNDFARINLKRFDHAYIIITDLSENLYQKVPGYSNVGRYTQEDFRRLRSDPSIDHVYDSLNIEIYKCDT